MFLKFEGRSVYSIAGAQGGGQDEARQEGSTTPCLEFLSQDVRSGGPEVRSEIVGDVGARQFLQVRLKLPFCVSPREVRVGLGETNLGEVLHHARSGESLGQENHVRVLGLD